MIIFHEVMKIQSFEFDVSDVTPANVHITFHHCFLHIFVNLMEKEPSKKFNGAFNRFLQYYEVKKFWNELTVPRRK